MSILVLYLFSIISTFLKIEILKVFSVLFLLLYLPGLLFFITAKKNSGLSFYDLIIAFPLSIGITSILTLGLLYLGINARNILLILSLISGLMILWLLVTGRKESKIFEISRGEILFVCIFTILTLLFSIPVLSERVAITVHGFHHASIVAQIINGIFPPENPGMGATKLSYQWGYHCLVAVISASTDIQALRIFSIINILCLLFIFCSTYRISRDFNFSEGYSYLVPFALIGLMRADAGILFIYNLVSGNLSVGTNPELTPSDIYLAWASKASYLDSRLFFLSKFYNANPMPVGICLIFAYFLLVFLLSKEDCKDKKGYSTAISFVLLGLAINYTVFLIIPVTHMPLWIIFIFLSAKGNYRERIKDIVELLLPCIVAAVISLPYVIYVLSGGTKDVGVTSTNPLVLAEYKIQKIKNLMAFWLSLPIILSGILIALRRYLGFSKKMFFILSGALVCLILADLLRLPWYDSYKFVFILAFFFAILFVFSVRFFLSLFNNELLKGFIIICVIFMLLLTPVMTEIAYIVSPWFKDDTYTFSGRHIIFKQDKQRNEAYLWIRDKTPTNSLVLLPYLSVSYPYWDTVAHNYTYRVSAMAERPYFVIKDVYAWRTGGYEERVRMRKYIFEDTANPELVRYLRDLNRDIYILMEDGYRDGYLSDMIFDKLPLDNSKIFNLVFNNNKQKVYHINLTELERR
ncbi:MAG: hypothetical protein QXT99_10335 [Candidatus Nitrosotenuis sp.]